MAPGRVTRLRSATLLLLVVAASGANAGQSEGDDPGQADEYAVKKFLRRRDAWLKQKYPTVEATLDSTIASFALPEHQSTVKEAKVTECKRQFVMAHKRFKAGDLPVHFSKYCHKSSSTGAASPVSPVPQDTAVFFVESEIGLEYAAATINSSQAQATSGIERRQTYVLALDGDEKGGLTAPQRLIDKARTLVTEHQHSVQINIMSARELAAKGISNTSAALSTSHSSQGLRQRPLKSVRDVRLAYSIFVSPNDPHWRIFRMMKLLYNPHDLFFIHVDALLQYHGGDGNAGPQTDQLLAESAEAVTSVKKLLQGYMANGNVKIEAIFDVSWGGVSMLNAEIAMFEALLRMGDWDYVINLSSSDLPLQNRSALLARLDQDFGKSFMWGVPQVGETVSKRGLTYTFVECEGHSYRITDERSHPLPKGIQLKGGSSWYLLHRGLAQLVVDCLESSSGRVTSTAEEGECGLVAHLLDYAQYKLSFEEIFFQTLASTSTFCELLVNNDLRYINWQKDRRTAQQTGCMHLEEVDWCGNSPQWMLADEYVGGATKEAVKGDMRYFARKFRDPRAFDAADDHLGIDSKEGMAAGLVEAMEKDEAAAVSGGRVLAENNVARGRRVEASSTQQDVGNPFQAQHLVDGDLATRWSSDFLDPQHVTVTLASGDEHSCNVSAVRLHWESAFATEYEVRVRRLGASAWETVVHDRRSRAKMGSQLVHTHEIGSLADTSRVQAVQVVGLRRASRWGYSMWELEVMGSCTDRVPAGGGGSVQAVDGEGGLQAAIRDSPAAV